MSLVCKEWRTPAQRALGRILAIQGETSTLNIQH